MWVLNWQVDQDFDRVFDGHVVQQAVAFFQFGADAREVALGDRAASLPAPVADPVVRLDHHRFAFHVPLEVFGDQVVRQNVAEVAFEAVGAEVFAFVAYARCVLCYPFFGCSDGFAVALDQVRATVTVILGGAHLFAVDVKAGHVAVRFLASVCKMLDVFQFDFHGGVLSICAVLIRVAASTDASMRFDYFTWRGMNFASGGAGMVPMIRSAMCCA